MYNCLVTKLKEVVNDDTLPIFVNVNDYEEYIDASGNESMTGDQKMAVAMFFSSIGANGVGGIFDKIKYLFLPLISADLAHSLVNYKTKQALSIPNGVVYSNHGIYATTATNKIITIPSVTTNNISIFWMRSGAMQSDSPMFQALAILDSSNQHIVHFSETNNAVKAFLGASDSNLLAQLSGVYLNEGLLKGVTIDEQDVYALNNTYSKLKDNQSSLSGTVTNAQVRLFSYGQMNMASSYPGCMLIVSDALTTEEVAILKNASEGLAQAFLVDEAS